MKAVVDKAAAGGVRRTRAATIEYLVGTMIELPRAALRAGEIAEDGEFFSLRHQRPDPDHARRQPRRRRALPRRLCRARASTRKDPFVSLDVEGVGELIEIAAERGRATRPDIKLGICGEHGGDPASIAFCEKVGLDYVSASPYRVPIARLAAAQAALRKRRRGVTRLVVALTKRVG